eukprot:CAMPEP_0178613994 /NCGR_PEP_ID=MMETSP0698-20121128/1935_1 /TAXON_ID=265572 /ORGANISM="Extubocellulus spinifer, Strain CCMP396" /LENGTH=301 /DNA_ID=CAMNT_0020252715 /DNA_START=1720 /DNA_END=2625 /DNA_ORIENTATION=+
MSKLFIDDVISETEWANEEWSKVYCSVYLQKKKYPPTNPRVSFDSEYVEHLVTKYTERRNSNLFITRDEVGRSIRESDRECGSFLKNKDATQWKTVTESIKSYNRWLLDSNATKIARGKYKGRLGFVVSISASKVHVKLSGDDKAVCVARSSIEEGYHGSFEDEAYERSINETSCRKSARKEEDKGGGQTSASRTADARIRRSKRIANRKKWNATSAISPLIRNDAKTDGRERILGQYLHLLAVSKNYNLICILIRRDNHRSHIITTSTTTHDDKVANAPTDGASNLGPGPGDEAAVLRQR